MLKKDNPTAPTSTTNKDKNAPNLAQSDPKQGGKVKPGKNFSFRLSILISLF